MKPAATILPLCEMSQATKLRIMEELWDDLCRSPEGVPSPAWHGEVLAARVERVAKGEAEFRDWAEVKERLLRKKE
ncbi:MAG: addiction module protein [Chthoniobacterales bacterium]